MWLLQLRLNKLARRIGELELELFALRDAAAPAHAETPDQKPAPAAEQEPLVLTNVVPDDELLLDTPLPEASNDDEEVAPPVAAPRPPPVSHAAPLLLDTPAPPPVAPPLAEPEAAPPPKLKRPPQRLDQWLAEKGLAWLAGIALAVGAVFLVSFVARSPWFTPPVQLGSALALGALLLGGSEWTRRIGLARPPGNTLVSAMLAGAGVVVLYATTWAAHGLYEFIDWPAAVGLLLVCALALLGLSFLHGQPLGVLAIGIALLAPALTQAPVWPRWALTVYVALVGAGGFAVAWERRWSWAAAATLAGFYFWFFHAIGVADVQRALALISVGSFGAFAMAFRAPLEDEDKAHLRWSQVSDLGPSVAISISSVLLMMWGWSTVALSEARAVAGPALISIYHVGLAAFAVRARLATPVTLAVTIGTLLVGFVIYANALLPSPPDPTFYPALLASAVTVILLALAAHPPTGDRVTVAAAGAVGAALLTLLAASSRGDSWHAPTAWVPLFFVAVALFAAGVRRESDAADRMKDLALDFWGGAAAVLLLAGIESALPAETRTVGHAAAALLLTGGLLWRGWRVLGFATLTAGALAIGQALSPTLIGATLSGHVPLWSGLLIYTGSAALLFGASTLVRRSGQNTGIAEALSTAAAIVAMTALFVGLRWLAAGGANTPLDAFTETSLRVLALMAAGLMLLPRIHETPGVIGAWRGHVLLGLGLLYALWAPGLAINPWWGGAGRAVVNGLPIFNALALAFLAPAALAFLAASRLYLRQLLFARIYAAAGGVLVLVWLVQEIRHAFHNASMAEPAIGLFESACYGLAFLAFALGVAIVGRMREERGMHRPFTHDLKAITRNVAWAAISASLLIIALIQHPIWGAQDSTTSNAFSTMLAVIAQFAALLLALALGRALSISTERDPARFAAATAAAIFAWSAGHCVIRWTHHRGYMDDGVALLGLEGLLHAVWPLAFVIAAAQLTRLAPGRDTVRAYLHDLQALWSAAVWPALGFAALGLWLLYNPWWGTWPAEVRGAGGAAAALVLYALAALLSYFAPDVPRVRGMKWMAPAATTACAVHIIVTATLIVRWLYHPGAMVGATAGDIELWTYSAAWAVFGGVTLWLGTVRNDPALRWVGLAAILATAGKVFFLDIGRLSGLALAASLIGLGIVAAVTAWFVRRNRPPPSPDDLVTVRPSARRERRRVRRRTKP